MHYWTIANLIKGTFHGCGNSWNGWTSFVLEFWGSIWVLFSLCEYFSSSSEYFWDSVCISPVGIATACQGAVGEVQDKKNTKILNTKKCIWPGMGRHGGRHAWQQLARCGHPEGELMTPASNFSFFLFKTLSLPGPPWLKVKESLGARWAPTSSLWPFVPALGPSSLLNFVFRPSATQAVWPYPHRLPLMHAFMMQVLMMHVSLMQVSMQLVTYPWCMCIYDRDIDQQQDKRVLGVRIHLYLHLYLYTNPI